MRLDYPTLHYIKLYYITLHACKQWHTFMKSGFWNDWVIGHRFIPIKIDDRIVIIAHSLRLPSSATSKRRETESTKCSFGCTSLIWHCILTDFIPVDGNHPIIYRVSTCSNHPRYPQYVFILLFLWSPVYGNQLMTWPSVPSVGQGTWKRFGSFSKMTTSTKMT